MRAQLGGTVESFAAAEEKEEEVSSQPGKRRRSHAAAAAAAAAAGPSAATNAPAAPPAPAPVPAAAPQPAAPPILGTVLPPDAEVRRLLLDELLDPAEGQDKLQLCRALKDRLQARISSVGDLTRVVSRGALGAEKGVGTGWEGWRHDRRREQLSGAAWWLERFELLACLAVSL